MIGKLFQQLRDMFKMDFQDQGLISNQVGTAGDSKVPFQKRVSKRRTKKKKARKARRKNK